MQILEVTELGLRSAALRLKHRTVPLRFVVIPMTHMANAGFYRDPLLEGDCCGTSMSWWQKAFAVARRLALR